MDEIEEEVEVVKAIFENVQCSTDEANLIVRVGDVVPSMCQEGCELPSPYDALEICFIFPRQTSNPNANVTVQANGWWVTQDIDAVVQAAKEHAMLEFQRENGFMLPAIEYIRDHCNCGLLINKVRKRSTPQTKPTVSAAHACSTPASPTATLGSPGLNGPLGGRLLRIDPGTHSNSFRKGIRIHHGRELVDRKSVFQAHLAGVQSMDDVQDVLDTLTTNNKYSRATHNMVSFRFQKWAASGEPLAVQDHDSDGEGGAGSKMQWLMQTLKVDNVLVIVSRWYGGTQLGPDRFKHINTLTREILEEFNFLGKNKK